MMLTFSTAGVHIGPAAHGGLAWVRLDLTIHLRKERVCYLAPVNFVAFVLASRGPILARLMRPLCITHPRTRELLLQCQNMIHGIVFKPLSLTQNTTLLVRVHTRARQPGARRGFHGEVQRGEGRGQLSMLYVTPARAPRGRRRYASCSNRLCGRWGRARRAQ